MATSRFANEPDLGYIFYPSARPGPGHPRLDVVINNKPTERHFDPENARFNVVSAQRSVETIAVHHPWRGSPNFQATAGRIVLHDRLGKTVEAFSFGGELEISNESERTICVLTSPVPIFDLTASQSVVTLFVSEVETELARRRAELARERALATYDRHMAEVKPVTLYTSCLMAIRSRLEPLAMRGMARYRRLYEFVRQQAVNVREGDGAVAAPALSHVL